MSFAKRSFEHRIETRGWAEQRLIENGAGAQCAHGNVISQRFDENAIYQIALEAAKGAPDNLSLPDVVEALQDAARELDFECRFCGR
jgi:hypothetical protein